ncbi:hypothetical protein QBC35DRAFT_483637 [Podospora australis]|uniref:Uncharacterized protein n=1 Tax=Podospora australis TaxID=1536484 RepID=A0AAN6X5A1_9PEZI|nr:hypothetical protein QBC35DRAFT_483637 [Podospora australis]
MADEIKKSYKRFTNNDFADGSASVLSTSLAALFGNAMRKSNQTTVYFITVGEAGYPLRVDVLLYSYSFTSDALLKIAKNVLIAATVFSQVDIRSLDDAALGAVVQMSYGGAPQDVQQRMLDRLLAVRDKPGH